MEDVPDSLDTQTRRALAALATHIVNEGTYADEDEHRSYGLQQPFTPHVQALVAELWRLHHAWLGDSDPAVCHGTSSMQVAGKSFISDGLLQLSPQDVAHVYVTDHCGEYGTLTLHVPNITVAGHDTLATGGLEYRLWTNTTPKDLTTQRDWRTYVRSWKDAWLQLRTDA